MGEQAIDLNADLGEEITDDAALLEVVTSANVACGYHAGTPEIMRSVCHQAVAKGVVIGAQVSYADRANFGRQPVEVAMEILREQVAHQVGTLAEIAREAGGEVAYVKPHGALYHRVLDDEEHAWAVLDGSVFNGSVSNGSGLPVLGMPGVLFDAAATSGRRTVLEGFPDRGYTDQGRLLPRDEDGAVLDDSEQIAVNAVSLASRVDSLCLHGDTPGAVVHAQRVSAALINAGWQLRSW